jgi:hypothetical protein
VLKVALEPHLAEPKLFAIATLVPYGLIYLTLTGPSQLKDRLRGRA